MPKIDCLFYFLPISLAVASVIILVVFYMLHILASNRRIRQAELLSTSVIKFSPALIIALDKQNRIVAFNKSIEQLSGYMASKIIGKNAKEVAFLPCPIMNGNGQVSLNGESPALRHADILQTSDGAERFVEWQVGTVRDEEVGLELTILSGIDVTELRLLQRKLKALTAKLSSAEERERKKIAEELHDRIGETLVLSARRIDDLKTKLVSEESGRVLDDLGTDIQQFLKDARSLIFELIPPILYDMGLEAAVNSFAGYCKKRHNISVTVSDDGREKNLNHDLAAFLYKTVRELVLNVIKHANAKAVHISLCLVEDAVSITVKDNGLGFKPSVLESDTTELTGFGLLNIKAQAEHYGGSLEISTNGKSGGTVSISVPLHRGVNVD